MPAYRFEAFRGKKVLIKGDVGSGKTALTARLLRQAVRQTPHGTITVIDMAPDRHVESGDSVGGTLLESNKPLLGVTFLRPEKVWAPRLEGRTKQETLRLALANARALGRLLERYLKASTSVLFVNDLTLYLHAGSMAKLLGAIRAAGTFVGNAYQDSYFANDRGSGLTERERRLLTKLERHMDVVIRL